MRFTGLQDHDDMLWLFETHLQPFNEEFFDRVKFGSAMLYGAEGSPMLVEIYEVWHPPYGMQPLQRFVRSGGSGNLVKLEGRFEKLWQGKHSRSVHGISFSETLRLLGGSMQRLLNLVAHDQGTLPVQGQPGVYVRFVAAS